MNRVELVGRITRDPELRYTSSNIASVRFTLAVNRNFTNQNGEREADFINCVAWRNQAENICKYLDKGSLVGIEGTIQTGSYTDDKGNKRISFDVVANRVEFLESKNKNAQNNENTVQNSDEDPYAEYGESVTIDDNFLD